MSKLSLHNSHQDSGLSAIHENGVVGGLLKVNAEDHLQISIKEPSSAFGDVVISNLEPRIQIDAIYGLLSSDVESLSATGGSTSSSNQMFVCESGTSVGGYGVIRSRRSIVYRPGQGLRIRFTAKFTTGVANSIQFAGPFSATNGYFVGYNGVNFGVGRRIPGKCEIRRLTITVGTGGNEVHTITLNSVVFNVVTSGVLTAARLAEELADNALTGWASAVSPKSNGATITFIQNVPGTANGTYSYTSNGTGAGTFSQLQAGAANDDTTAFVRQSKFNWDVLDGSNRQNNPTGETLDPTKLNVYQIVIPYLGAGSIRFSRMDGSGHFELMHVIEYTNTQDVPSQTNPSYKLGWISASLGSTSNLIVKGASAAGFIEGDLASNRYPFSFSSTLSAGTTEYIIFAIRNRGEFVNTNNQRQIQLLNVNAALDTSNRIATVYLYLNPTLTGTTDWTYVNQSLSAVEYSVPSTLTPSSGVLIQSFIITSSPQLISLQALQTRLTPGDVLGISCKTFSGSAQATCSINWFE